MKAQFKYAFLAGIYARTYVFAVIFTMNLVFITLGSAGLLPFAAHITAVSLGGVAIAVMMAFNIAGDVAIARRMFSVPEAYLHALTPAPRWKILLASIVAMMTLDFITMAVVITGEVWLSLTFAGVWNTVIDFIRGGMDFPYFLYGLQFILLLIAGYLLTMTFILFCVTAKKSIFYKSRYPFLMTLLLACGCIYVLSLLLLILAPFGSVGRFGIFIIISLSDTALPFYILLTLLKAAGLFYLTSKLMERRMNI
jgi:hypothetical protein